MKLELGKKALAIRHTWDNRFEVVECVTQHTMHGIRNYGHNFESKYKTLTGAQKSLARWDAHFGYLKYAIIGLIPKESFRGELAD